MGSAEKKGHSGIRWGGAIALGVGGIADMKSLDRNSFHAQSLGIATPWRFADVGFVSEHKVVTVFVECALCVAHAGLRHMIMVAKTVKRHPWGIAGSVTNPLTNAAMERLNLMIQSIRHSALGLPNSASLRTRVLFHLGGLQLKPS